MHKGELIPDILGIDKKEFLSKVNRYTLEFLAIMHCNSTIINTAQKLREWLRSGDKDEIELKYITIVHIYHRFVNEATTGSSNNILSWLYNMFLEAVDKGIIKYSLE